jgi:hypothetical protein
MMKVRVCQRIEHQQNKGSMKFIAKYVNASSYTIQGDFNILNFNSIVETYK